MNETLVTLVGRACEDPERRVGASGVVFTKFRLATSPRRWNARAGKFEDGVTSYYSILAFAQMAENITSSVHKGDPLIIQGKQTVKTFRREDGSMAVTIELDAVHIGHDLARGATTFLKGGRLTVDPNDRTTDPAINQLRVEQDAGSQGAWDSPPAQRMPAWAGGPTDDGQRPSHLPALPQHGLQPGDEPDTFVASYEEIASWGGPADDDRGEEPDAGADLATADMAATDMAASDMTVTDISTGSDEDAGGAPSERSPAAMGA
jgi:single-strand DNA-binding protein